MTKKITKTIDSRIFTVKALRISERKIIEKEVEDNSRIAVGEAVKTLQKKYNTKDERIISITKTEHKSGLYEMTEDEFISHSEIVKARKFGAYIVRTIMLHNVTVLGVSGEEAVEKQYKVKGSYDKEKMLEAWATEDFIPVEIIADVEEEELRQMSDADFAKYGRKVEKEKDGE